MVCEISRVYAREILDSRGNPTIEVEVETSEGVHGVASVPSGASKGKAEAIELRDGGERYHGLGVRRAINSVKTIETKLLGLDVRMQSEIDKIMIELDGTENKSRLGANAILGVSLACAKAGAFSNKQQLFEYIGGLKANLIPIPFFNIINGGKHAGNRLDFQEFMIVPIDFKDFKEAVRMGSEIYHALRRRLLKEYGKTSINVGDEGGFAPPMENPREALDTIVKSIEEMGYEEYIRLALDPAASNFYDGNGRYIVAGEAWTREELFDYYLGLVEDYPIVSLEDPLYEEDFEGFKDLAEELDIQIIGDDLFTTNMHRLSKGIEKRSGNAIVLKVNQVGTLTEALETGRLAMRSGYRVQTSHRSGETEDTFISDLAVAIRCGQIKSGAPCRGERIAKYNRLIRIEEHLGERAEYPRGLFK
ncbi:MAG: phosphopyruvate hydratase [Candidatus Bathyarchaeia archaeon]